MSEEQWYFARNNQQSGPHSSTQFNELAQAGQLEPTDLVWRQGLIDWVPAHSIEGLLPKLSTSGPPPLPRQPLIIQPASTTVPLSRTHANWLPVILDNIRRKLPGFHYTVSKTIRRKDFDDKALLNALRAKLRGCETSICQDGSMEVTTLDQSFLSELLGTADSSLDPWWFARCWRDVTAKVTVTKLHEKANLVVEVNQGWTRCYVVLCILALPFLFFGIAVWTGSTLICWWAKSWIASALQKDLNELADELE